MSVTKIHGQPTHLDITKLEEELVEAAIHIPTPLGGGQDGHIGLICNDPTYLKYSNGILFVRPTQPPALPATAALQAESQRAIDRQFIENVRTFNKYLGVEQGIKDKIIEAVESEYLLELKEGILGYHNVTARGMLDHLRKRGGGSDHTNITKIPKERDEPWDGVESPAVYFARVEKNIKLLSHVTPNPIVTDLTERMMAILSAFAEFGNLNPASMSGNRSRIVRRRGTTSRYSSLRSIARQRNLETHHDTSRVRNRHCDASNLRNLHSPPTPKPTLQPVFEALTEMKRSME